MKRGLQVQTPRLRSEGMHSGLRSIPPHTLSTFPAAGQPHMPPMAQLTLCFCPKAKASSSSQAHDCWGQTHRREVGDGGEEGGGGRNETKGSRKSWKRKGNVKGMREKRERETKSVQEGQEMGTWRSPGPERRLWGTGSGSACPGNRTMEPKAGAPGLG